MKLVTGVKEGVVPSEEARVMEHDKDVAPPLSVTVLNYNYARYLAQCLDSILSQTWTDFELILINDCSTDHSMEVIERYVADPRVRVVNHERNRGFVASLIEGAQLSRGKYLMVISADDYCLSDQAFASLLQPLEADETVVLSYSTPGWYANDGTCHIVVRPHEQSYVRSGEEEFLALAAGNPINHSGAIIRAGAYAAIGGYDPSLRYAVDCVMWLMLCSQGKVAYRDAQLFAYRQHDTNMSSSRDGFRVGLREHMEGIKKGFDVMSGTLGTDYKQQRAAIQGHLLNYSGQHYFDGHLEYSWYAHWWAVRVNPFSIVSCTRTLALLARTVLGRRHYQRLRSNRALRFLARPALLSLRAKS